MNRRLSTHLNRLLLFGVSLLVGCGTTASLPPTPAVQASLTAAVTPVQLSGAGSQTTDLHQDQTVPLLVNDGVMVPESGHGVVRFGDRLTVDVLRSSQFSVTGIQQQSDNSLFVTLKQVKGHSRVSLSENANARVRLETDFATLTTLKAGTEFMVCHDPTVLTCMVVLKGEVEVAAQNKVVTVKGGEGTYILKGKPPFDPICAHLDQVDTWFDEKLGTAQVEALGELVAGWKQAGCATTAEAAQTPEQAITAEPVLPSAQGMLKIPAGSYTLGSATADDFHIAAFQKEMPDFWIDIYEVTNADYKKFVDDTGHPPPSTLNSLNPWPGKEKHPVAGISWNDATAYCEWVHKRLPTEAEWEVAARGAGPNPPLYPWGDDPDAGGKVGDLPLTDTYDVGSIAFNKSPLGVFDMAGTLWQWVGDPYAPVKEGTQVLRGGRHGLIQDMAYRQTAEPQSERFVPFAGFRCAADQVQGG